MDKKEIIAAVQEALGEGVKTKQAVEAYDAVCKVFENALLEGKDLKFGNLGKFSIGVSPARVGHNPQNPSEKINIPAKKKLRFSASKTIKTSLNP